MSVKRFKQYLLLSYIAAITFICLFFRFQIFSFFENDVSCFSANSRALPSISTQKPSTNKNIFFHESSCKSAKSKKIVITSRQACSVESAARLHPNYTVYLLYVAPAIIKLENTESDLFLEAIMSYSNVKVLHVDLEKYVKNTAVEDLHRTQKIQHSKFAVSHTSDALRYLSLWKYGGIYLDLDVIVIKPLDALPKNFAGAESSKAVAAGVLRFDSDSSGYKIASQCLLDFQNHFSGTKWGNNGPGVITRVALQFCNAKDVKEMLEVSCAADLKVFPPEVFYPVHWKNWEVLFTEATEESVKSLVEDSYVVHMWNKLSSQKQIHIDQNVVYSILAKEFCPRVFRVCKQYF